MPKPTSHATKSVKSKPGHFAIAILAAGKGIATQVAPAQGPARDRRKAALLAHVVAAASQVVPPQSIFAIIGHEADHVREALAPTGINFVLQREQRGTGHAMMEARSALQNFETVLVLSGDVPLIRAETIEQVRDFHNSRRSAMTMLTAEPPDPTGYGRVFRKQIKGKESDEVERVVEQEIIARYGSRTARDQLRHLRVARDQATLCPHPAESSRPTMPITSTTSPTW